MAQIGFTRHGYGYAGIGRNCSRIFADGISRRPPSCGFPDGSASAARALQSSHPLAPATRVVHNGPSGRPFAQARGGNLDGFLPGNLKRGGTIEASGQQFFDDGFEADDAVA